MATVFRCRSAVSDRLQGALKVVDVRGDPTGRGRFVREIETLSSLRHQAIVRVLSAGEDPDRGALYMVLELIEGGQFMSAQGASNFGGMFAMSVVSLVPVFLAFLFGQRFLIRGIATTGIK